MPTDTRSPETGESRRDRTPRRFWRGLVSLAALLLTVCLCFGAGALWAAWDKGAPEITSDLLTNRIQQAQELVTVKYLKRTPISMAGASLFPARALSSLTTAKFPPG